MYPYSSVSQAAVAVNCNGISVIAAAHLDHGNALCNFGEHGRTPLARSVKCFTVARHTLTTRSLMVYIEPDLLAMRRTVLCIVSRKNPGRGSKEMTKMLSREARKRKRVTEPETG